MKTLATILTAAGVALAIGLTPGAASAKKKNKKVRASADIYTCGENPEFIGTASLKEEKSDEGVKQVRISIHVEGLTPGEHAVHIHEFGRCEPCGDAGGHFDPGPNGNSSPDGNHPFHMGDLVNIDVNRRGHGNLNVDTTRITLSAGPLSVLDEDGSAFIIHDNADTYCPEGVVAGCAGGSRAACGIIVRD